MFKSAHIYQVFTFFGGGGGGLLTSQIGNFMLTCWCFSWTTVMILMVNSDIVGWYAYYEKKKKVYDSFIRTAFSLPPS